MIVAFSCSSLAHCSFSKSSADSSSPSSSSDSSTSSPGEHVREILNLQSLLMSHRFLFTTFMQTSMSTHSYPPTISRFITISCKTGMKFGYCARLWNPTKLCFQKIGSKYSSDTYHVTINIIIIQTWQCRSSVNNYASLEGRKFGVTK